MAVEITMPQLSDTMSEGTLIRWHKKEGDVVKAGEEIAEVETDKATMPMEAFEAGTLALVEAKEGEKVKVGGRLGVIAVGGEDPAAIRKQFAGGGGTGAAGGSGGGAAGGAKQSAVAATSVKAQVKGDVKAQRVPAGGVPAAQGASSHDVEMGAGPLEVGRTQSRREQVKTEAGTTSESMAQEATETIARARAAPAGSHGAAGHEGGRLKVSPLAKRIAAEQGVDLSQITGTGPGGRIIQRDVLVAAEHKGEEAPKKESSAALPVRTAGIPQTTARAVAISPMRPAAGTRTVIPLSKMRMTIAHRLQQSKQNIPHFYETIDVDVEEMLMLRQRVNSQMEKENLRLSLGDFIAKSIGSALLMHPVLNSSFNGTEVTQWGDVNLGMAVALDDGLIVPVLRGINQMGLREIRVRSADLIERARIMKLRQDELTGATFTVSNLGTYGVREFSAIINPPEVAILAVGAAQKRAVVYNDALAARMTMTLTLSCDHRVVDGATAADFLRTLKQLLEEPGMMLV